jgi:hypothetical protein
MVAMGHMDYRDEGRLYVDLRVERVNLRRSMAGLRSEKYVYVILTYNSMA